MIYNPPPSSGSGGLTVLPITSGIIDDSNVAFGFASLPTLIGINGMLYQQTGGSYTWTWDGMALTATLSIPVGVNGCIFGII